MTIVLSLILGLFAYLMSKQIRQSYLGLVVITSIIAILSIVLESDITEIVTQGLIGLAFFVVVMFAGAFPKQSKVSKRLRSVRKEYSIVGFILLIPHATTYIVQFLEGSYPTEWIGLIAFTIMVPLLITSFGKVKKKMEMKKWKEIQKYAYLAYALTFIHLIMVSEGANQISYIIIFGLNTFFKLTNYVFKSYSFRSRTLYSLLIIGALVGTTYLGLNIENISAGNLPGVDYSEIDLVDGMYTGTASGFKNLPTELTVTVDNGEITDISFEEIGATAPHHGTDYEEAAYNMVAEILSKQSTDIDSISGATTTTKSVLEAVNKALEEQIKVEE